MTSFAPAWPSVGAARARGDAGRLVARIGDWHAPPFIGAREGTVPDPGRRHSDRILAIEARRKTARARSASRWAATIDTNQGAFVGALRLHRRRDIDAQRMERDPAAALEYIESKRSCGRGQPD